MDPHSLLCQTSRVLGKTLVISGGSDRILHYVVVAQLAGFLVAFFSGLSLL